jgi:hypothetical protein
LDNDKKLQSSNNDDRSDIEASVRQQLGYDQGEVLGGLDKQVLEQAVDRELQELAAAKGQRVAQKGEPPRINNFFLIRTTMEPEAFVDFVDREVLNKNEVRTEPCDAMMGMITMRFTSGLPAPGKALPMLVQGKFSMPLVKVEPMILAKLDAGPWPWYDRVSTEILAQIVERLEVRALVCGWSIDKEWSWVEAWRPHRKTGIATMTETIDGPSNGEVTRKAYDRWHINVRDAFDALHLAAQFEALRRWLILPGVRPLPYTSHVSFLAGKLLIQSGDEEWIPRKWSENFPGRKPEDGPLHLQRYYIPRNHGEMVAKIDQDKKRKALSFRQEPPSSGL